MDRANRRTVWRLGALLDCGLALVAVALFFSDFPWVASIFALLGGLCVQRGVQNLRASARARALPPTIVALIRVVASVALLAGGVALILVLALIFGMLEALPAALILLLALLVLLNAGASLSFLRTGALADEHLF